MFASTLFLGAFAKLRKAIVGFLMSVRPPVTTRLSLNGFLMRFDISVFFGESVEKFQANLNNVYFNAKTNMHYLAQIFFKSCF